MKAVEAGFKGIKVFSLPSMGQDGSRIHVELGVRGDPAQVEPAMAKLRRLVAMPASRTNKKARLAAGFLFQLTALHARSGFASARFGA